MNSEAHTMIDHLQPAQVGYAARPPLFAVSAAFLAMSAGLLGGCAADRPLRTPDVSEVVRTELQSAAPTKPVTVPTRISDVLAEPTPPVVVVPTEPKLDLLVNNAQAREVFLAIVADTRYSMLMHPDVAGTLSVTLRGVTVLDALDAIRDVYGYDFKVDGRRITIYAPTLQTRIFTVNYPHSQRVGNSELRVASGATMQSSSSGNSASGAGTSSGSGQQGESSRVSTTSKTDLWTELAGAVRGMLGSGAGRSVITSPQAGIMAVHAMPDELRQVDKFLKAAQISVERQVMLEAKIVEVELRDGYQSGIDWSALKSGASGAAAVGVIGGSTGSNTLVSGVQAGLPGFAAGAALLADGVSLPSAGTGLFGLALARGGFQAVLGFLETQGDVQILSSPRIATLNNQKAVLKVGSEDFFVTNVSSGTTTSSTATGSTSNSSLPTLTLTPFFSGISLDVTPQIDDGKNIMLHVHPSVTTVTEKSKEIDLGSVGNYRLPLASSSVNETDTLVRVQDGNIVAIGGLMQISTNRSASGLPGTADVPFLSSLFGNRANSGSKKEVVVLIKPTIIRTPQDWEAQTSRSRAALDDLDSVRARVIRIDGSVVEASPKSPVK